MFKFVVVINFILISYVVTVGVWDIQLDMEHQWDPTEDILRTVLIPIVSIINLMMLYSYKDDSWFGLYLKRKKAEERKRIKDLEQEGAKQE